MIVEKEQDIVTADAYFDGHSRRAGESPTQRALRRFRRNRLAVIGTGVLFVLALLSAGSPLWQRYQPNAIDLAHIMQPPSLAHWLGTDLLGRDVWSRVLNGGRVSLAVGLMATLISLTMGVVIGALSGYYLGWVDMALQRFTDVVMSFPSIILMMTLAVFAGPSLLNTILIIGAVSWPPMTRLIRAEFLSGRERVYVEAARNLGATSTRIIFRHILPNSLAPLLAQTAFSVGLAILTEAGLSFLGIGVPLPTPSWGNMLEDARQVNVLVGAPWMWMPPAFMTVLTVLCVNFVGDGLRDAFDPRILL